MKTIPIADIGVTSKKKGVNYIKSLKSREATYIKIRYKKFQ
jgi:hypothetical protein